MIVNMVGGSGGAEYDGSYEYLKYNLEELSWDEISTISKAGLAGAFFDVGDKKSVEINGTVGSLALDTTLYTFVIGINHRGENGITFQGFKDVNGKDLCLVNNYSSQTTDGTLNYNMNHWGNYNYGGWKGCDFRYDILGSTDVEPSGYGAAVVSGSRVGYDATSTAATNPVANTLMAALPSTLRAIMRPMTVYTDNVSTSSHNTEAGVTTSVDYLPLLAEYEIFGVRTNANQYEQNYQSQYDYYVNGNSKVKYKHSATSSTAAWWERSPHYSSDNSFCYVGISGAATYGNSHNSRGLAPMFLI